jgi:hypothetical protein
LLIVQEQEEEFAVVKVQNAKLCIKSSLQFMWSLVVQEAYLCRSGEKE